ILTVFRRPQMTFPHPRDSQRLSMIEVRPRCRTLPADPVPYKAHSGEPLSPPFLALALHLNWAATGLRLMSLPGPKRSRKGERSPRGAEECAAPAWMLQAMVDHVAEAVAMFDANQRLVAWNRQLPAILDVPASLL